MFEQALADHKFLISSSGQEYRKDYETICNLRLQEVSVLLTTPKSITSPVPHQYLQSLLTKIIDVNPELKKLNIRLVFSRDWWPNAYSMGEGTLVVNAGLMVFLSNEAELVFILCHELSHLYLDHGTKNIRNHIATINSEAFKNELKRLSKQDYGAGGELDKLAKKFAFSNRRHRREHEAEADSHAFLLMKNTGFDCNGITTCLKLLDKIDDSLLFKPLKLDQVFNFPEYPFKIKWVKSESSIFAEMTLDDTANSSSDRDSLKTHPDCSQRIKFLEDSIKNIPSGSQFLVSKQVFNKLRSDLFLEMTEQQFRENNLTRNLYYNLQLLQNGLHVENAVHGILRSLNVLYKSQKEHTIGLHTEKEARGLPEDYNLLLRMIDRLKLGELGTIAYLFGQKYQSEMSGNALFAEESKISIINNK